MKLEEIRKLMEAATPGPWYAAVEFGSLVVRSPDVATRAVAFWLDRTQVTPDAAFIAAMRTLAPKFLEFFEATRHYFFEPCSDGQLAQEQYQRMRALILAWEHGSADAALAALEAE